MPKVISEKPLRNASTLIQWRTSILLSEKNCFKTHLKQCDTTMEEVDTFATFLNHLYPHQQPLAIEKTRKWKMDQHRVFKLHYTQKKLIALYRFVQFLIDNSFDMRSRKDPFFHHVDEVFEMICTLQNNVDVFNSICHDDDLKLKGMKQHVQGLISLSALCMHYAHSEIFMFSKTRSQIIRFHGHIKLLVDELRKYKIYQPHLIDDVNIAGFEHDMKTLLYQSASSIIEKK